MAEWLKRGATTAATKAGNDRKVRDTVEAILGDIMAVRQTAEPRRSHLLSHRLFRETARFDGRVGGTCRFGQSRSGRSIWSIGWRVGDPTVNLSLAPVSGMRTQFMLCRKNALGDYIGP
jgi:hypothetical protein